MRVTVEITDIQRARLLRLAALRGEKGLSALVREAIDHYLRSEPYRRASVKGALSVLGTLGDKEVGAMRETTRALRKGWR